MFETKLLAWHDANARSLPWCGETDPYRIWISEIMLQQTRTETVAGYYRAFLADFPDVHALAAATQEQVFKRWEGLGYYSRARNLHAAARMIVDRFGGRLPDTAEGLLRLPGVGDYTAGAVASIAFGRRELAMDGNAVRVFSRVFAEERCVGESATRKSLKAAGTSLMSDERPGDFNQAIMGLGNMICVPLRPKCDLCPVRAFCLAEKRGIQAGLPHLPPKPEKKRMPVGVALVRQDDRILLVRRPDEGLLAGLWGFPAFENARSEADVREALAETGVVVGRGERLPEAEHVFTHRVWKMKGWRFTAVSAPPSARWVDATELRQAAIPTAFRLYRQIAEETINGIHTEETD